jgi:lauroyl/myristoyl acyltransferase
MNGFQEQVTKALPPDVAAQLESALWPPLDARMPPAGLSLRLKTSPWIRRLMPTRLVVERAERRAQAIWDADPAEREHALAMMKVVVAGTEREHELERLARERLIESAANTAIYWQPWPVPDIDEESAANLDGALVGDRGVLLSPCHLGPYYGTMLVMPPRGRTPFAVSGEWFFEPPSHDLWGRRLARWRRDTVCVCVPAKGSFAVLRALLEQGQLVLVYFDMPGHNETSFLGKRTMLADGCARLSVETDAPVLPMRARREGHRVWLDVAAPVDPRDFASADQLHAHLARLHERWILEAPHAMDDPRSFGWEDGATADAWLRPGEGAHARTEPAERT